MPDTSSPAADAVGVDVAQVLRTLADPTRLRLFVALQDKERCVSDLVASEALAQPLVSHHLQILVRAGLVESRRANGFSLYALSPEGIAEARAAIMRLLDTDAISPLALPGGNPACCR